MTKAELNARLAQSLSTTALKKTALADLQAMVDAQNDTPTEPTLGKIISNLTDLQRRVVVALLDAGMECNGAETLDAMRADNMTFSDVAELATRTGLSKKQVQGVLSGLSGIVDCDVEKPNGQPGVDQVLTDFGVIVAFELLADGVEAKAKQAAPKQKVAPKPAPAPKKARVLDDRIITQPATDAKHVKAVTQGSKRHLLIQALEKGATIDDLMTATGWGKDTVTSALRWDVSQAGLGCERKGGKYYLIMPKGFTKPAIVEKGQARVDALGAAK
jgi:hypothetical protein